MNLFKRHTYYLIILIRFFSICIVFKIIQKSRTFFLKIKEKRDTIPSTFSIAHLIRGAFILVVEDDGLRGLSFLYSSTCSFDAKDST